MHRLLQYKLFHILESKVHIHHYPPHTHTQGRTNLSPDKVPWSALRTLLSQCIYGGRIDNEFDQRLLDSFVNRLFTVKSFESEFALMGDIDGQRGKSINMPDGIRWVWGETSVHTGCGGGRLVYTLGVGGGTSTLHCVHSCILLDI